MQRDRLLTLVLAFLAGALVRDVIVSRAAAGDAEVFTRLDAQAIVRALQAQADATKDIARAVSRIESHR